jgi:L-lactate dehydrogenase
MTAHFARDFGLPSTRIVGSGTTLDTARFRTLLGQRVGVDARHIHAYVVGEHGDSEVLTWSIATIGGMPLDQFCQERNVTLDDAERAEIDDAVRRAAYYIIEGKGATYYGIGAALARITNVILSDQRSILTVCTPSPEVAGVPDVTVALPRLVGGAGVMDEFPPLLNADEMALLNKSATVVRNAIESLHLE